MALCALQIQHNVEETYILFCYCFLKKELIFPWVVDHQCRAIVHLVFPSESRPRTKIKDRKTLLGQVPSELFPCQLQFCCFKAPQKFLGDSCWKFFTAISTFQVKMKFHISNALSVWVPAPVEQFLLLYVCVCPHRPNTFLSSSLALEWTGWFSCLKFLQYQVELRKQAIPLLSVHHGNN